MQVSLANLIQENQLNYNELSSVTTRRHFRSPRPPPLPSPRCATKLQKTPSRLLLPRRVCQPGMTWQISHHLTMVGEPNLPRGRAAGTSSCTCLLDIKEHLSSHSGKLNASAKIMHELTGFSFLES